MTNLGECPPDVETSMLITSQTSMANHVYHPPQPSQHGPSRRISTIYSSVDKYWSFTAPFYNVSDEVLQESSEDTLLHDLRH
jgi:hypothetical protein